MIRSEIGFLEAAVVTRVLAPKILGFGVRVLEERGEKVEGVLEGSCGGERGERLVVVVVAAAAMGGGQIF